MKQDSKNYKSGISRVIFNGPATIILWSDGTKTIAKTHEDDAFDPEKGFAVACAKKQKPAESTNFRIVSKGIGYHIGDDYWITDAHRIEGCAIT